VTVTEQKKKEGQKKGQRARERGERQERRRERRQRERERERERRLVTNLADVVVEAEADGIVRQDAQVQIHVAVSRRLIVVVLGGKPVLDSRDLRLHTTGPVIPWLRASGLGLRA